jgi:hypothetical protein
VAEVILDRWQIVRLFPQTDSNTMFERVSVELLRMDARRPVFLQDFVELCREKLKSLPGFVFASSMTTDSSKTGSVSVRIA